MVPSSYRTRSCILLCSVLLSWLQDSESFVIQTLSPRPTRISRSRIAAATDETIPQETSSSLAGTRTTGFNATLSFPQSYGEILSVPYGDCIESETFSICDTASDDAKHSFRLKVYPRGGGHTAKAQGSSSSGFGMAYRQFLSSNRKNERVGVYLQYLPSTSSQTVDATFALRMIGRQTTQRRFNVEWRAGMRFTSDTNLAQGRANDFGAHLMQTSLLEEFWGIQEDTAVEGDRPLVVQVEILLHHGPAPTTPSPNSHANKDKSPLSSLFPDMREQSSDLRVGSVVVPVLRRLSQRPDMMAQGAYPGVEYRILRMTNDKEGDVFYYQPNVTYDLKPIYPLVPQLERPWPVTVTDASIPKLVSPGTYNLVSALGSLATAVTGLTTAFLLSTFLSFFVIPSRSMEPTLQVGDVLLVEKVTPRLQRLVGGSNSRPGEIVLFTPPTALRNFVAERNGVVGSRDLFVKRVAAGTPGATVDVDSSTGGARVEENGREQIVQNQRCVEPSNLALRYIPESNNKDGSTRTVLDPGQVMVMGDCGPVSIDSRVWGPLPETSIVGRPLLRMWPLSRVGPVE